MSGFPDRPLDGFDRPRGWALTDAIADDASAGADVSTARFAVAAASMGAAVTVGVAAAVAGAVGVFADVVLPAWESSESPPEDFLGADAAELAAAVTVGSSAAAAAAVTACTKAGSEFPAVSGCAAVPVVGADDGAGSVAAVVAVEVPVAELPSPGWAVVAASVAAASD